MKNNRQGFSLVEMLVALAIGMMIAGSIVSLLVSQMQLSATTNRNVMNQENLREVTQFLCDEIRLAYAADGSEPISTADTTAMSFTADIDANGIMDSIDYYIVDSTLMRRYTTTDGVNPFIAEDALLHNVQSILFTYYARGDVAPANIEEITSVEVQLQLDTSAEDTAFTSARLAQQLMVGRATIRNKL